MFKFGTQAGSARPTAESIFTLLGEGTHWQGEIHAGANGLRVEGLVEGTILSEGQVVVGPTGVIKGTIHAKHITVMGRVEGIVKVSGCLEIMGTGWVEGEVELTSLVVDEGGTLQGTCQQPVRPKQQEPVPLVPRRDERVQDRYAPVVAVNSGTNGAPPVSYPASQKFERNRF